MENKHLPAYPQPIAECNGGLSETMDYNNQSVGLTKRELLAAMAMQGLCANNFQTSMDLLAIRSVQIAEQLLAELSKPQP